ncbi:MAG TPA: DIP1984 family protein [Ktedonobacteraceae bacterium]|nr:DIP1984 family protein [Ktedonobacteraceae bacterium]
MKLAEALVLRADVQKRLLQLRERLRLSALVQEGEQPPEDPQELLRQLNQLLEQLEGLIIQINRANMQTRLADGTILTDALARRDILMQRHSILNNLADTASNRMDRYGRSEIRKLSTVDVTALRQQMDEIARDLRELDIQIQATNWTSELPESTD